MTIVLPVFNLCIMRQLRNDLTVRPALHNGSYMYISKTKKKTLSEWLYLRIELAERAVRSYRLPAGLGLLLHPRRDVTVNHCQEQGVCRCAAERSESRSPGYTCQPADVINASA